VIFTFGSYNVEGLSFNLRQQCLTKLKYKIHNSIN